MPKKPDYHITFAITHEDDPHGVIVETLRYADQLSVNGGIHGGSVPFTVQECFRSVYERNQKTGCETYLVTITCPKSIDGGIWCRQNVQRMRSFGITAVGWKGNVGAQVTLEAVEEYLVRSRR